VNESTETIIFVWTMKGYVEKCSFLNTLAGWAIDLKRIRFTVEQGKKAADEECRVL
jgi:hypothetical protein